MAFRPGGEYLPYDWVDEGKLLLFVKTQSGRRARATALQRRRNGRRKRGQRVQRGTKTRTRRAGHETRLG